MVLDLLVKTQRTQRRHHVVSLHSLESVPEEQLCDDQFLGGGDLARHPPLERHDAVLIDVLQPLEHLAHGPKVVLHDEVPVARQLRLEAADLLLPIEALTVLVEQLVEEGVVVQRMAGDVALALLQLVNGRLECDAVEPHLADGVQQRRGAVKTLPDLLHSDLRMSSARGLFVVDVAEVGPHLGHAVDAAVRHGHHLHHSLLTCPRRRRLPNRTDRLCRPEVALEQHVHDELA
mmetsp:Transcript_30459/g.88545  ORF Transcript_30459/g.88545 Transcript_30459/m.88545 type:complete len:233 (+) Transcript_30459:1865-2563(+)